MKLSWTVMDVEIRYLHFWPSLLIVTFLSLTVDLYAQVPPLEREVTISFSHEKITMVLTRLSEKGAFVFSYSPSILDPDEEVTASYSRQTVRAILSNIFKGRIDFKQKGNYIILIKTSTPSAKAAPPKTLTVTGYVVDKVTGEKLAEASVYDKKSLVATITDEFGYFKLVLDKPDDVIAVSVSKRDYLDTLLHLQETRSAFVTVALQPNEILLSKDSIGPIMVVDSMMAQVAQPAPVPVEWKPASRQSQINMENIRDTLRRKFAISYVPFVGTNHKLSGNVVNDFSLNVLGGYSMGTAQLEVAGVFNVNRSNVKHVQVAGVFNVVGGKVTGTQLAGVANINGKGMEGVQLAGDININLGNCKGPQFAGLMNFNTASSEGAQFAGLVNIQIKDYKGSQFAGLMNVTTGEVTGSQIAGVINVGRKVQGTQIGLINISDSIRGVPIGLLNFVRSGYHKLEISSDEVFYTNFAFRTGVRQFYTIISAGVKPDNFDQSFWTYGYGIGTAPRLARKLSLNLDLTVNHLQYADASPSFNLLNKFYLGVDFHLAKNFSITCGATLNAYVFDKESSLPVSIFTDYQPTLLEERAVGDNNMLQMWMGGKIGVRFF